ncbi:metallophosphoesterase [Sphingobacterium sp. lm-10]|uniref:metallophosphoesterase family protein n=1 Tax=Sphingobacterium sp. lm-10 TaxID=2944904 RepID=UPI0020201E33|nr:metallophosphoesterase [Sphingobacterium sp. lm-10]MCL7989230.1 metallophosphoesterase [Sphingobacterium sp. lm-10]
MVKSLKWPICLLVTLVGLTFSTAANAQNFKFAFITDLHVHSDSTLNEVQKLLHTLPKDVEFVVSGGDNVDVDNQSAEKLPAVRSRYAKLKAMLSATSRPYYMAIGNHDRLPAKMRDGANDFQLFEEAFGDTYQSFEHKGAKFIVLNSVYTDSSGYIVPEKQKEWLAKVLNSTPRNMPIVVITHVPFLSVYYPVLEGKYTATDTFTNQKEIMDMFTEHNLQLVLQGHMHLYEEIKVKNVDYITAGAVSGNWWHGAFFGTKPGYLILEMKDGKVTWSYQEAYKL